MVSIFSKKADDFMGNHEEKVEKAEQIDYLEGDAVRHAKMTRKILWKLDIRCVVTWWALTSTETDQLV